MRARVAAREAQRRRRWLWRAVLAVGMVAAVVIWSQRPQPVVVSEEEMVRRTRPTISEAAPTTEVAEPAAIVFELPLVAPSKRKPRSTHAAPATHWRRSSRR